MMNVAAINFLKMQIKNEAEYVEENGTGTEGLKYMQKLLELAEGDWVPTAAEIEVISNTIYELTMADSGAVWGDTDLAEEFSSELTRIYGL
jgi:hypothetical protein